MAEIENPVIHKMLDGLRIYFPDLFPVLQQGADTAVCLPLVCALGSWPKCWLTCSDLARRIGQSEEQVQTVLRCMLQHGIVIELQVPGTTIVFYRLADDESRTEIVDALHNWCQSWRAWLQDAHKVLRDRGDPATVTWREGEGSVIA
jgi:predicted transcriptional regulator